jgi:NarL family two-component system response regulator LiaR
MGLTVTIVDDQRLTLDGIRFALRGCEGMEVIDAVVSAAELLASLKQHTPEVVLMSADLQDMDALKCLGLLRQNYPTVKVGVLFADRDLDRIHSALAAGAAACLMKNVHPEDLPAAIRQVVEATVYTATSQYVPAAVAPSHRAIADLTDRELTMLKAIARGLSNKAISKELWVTEQTVKFHLNNVYRKLGVPNRTAAARYAYSHGLLEADHADMASAI